MTRLKSIDVFRVVYYVIAIATAQHTAWGAATTMQGSTGSDTLWWWLQGAGFAVAVDYSMIAVAAKLRSGASRTTWLRLWRLSLPVNWYAITFIVVALVSAYFQLLYAWKHSDAILTGTGVASEWVIRLQGLISARIIIAPLALPVIATMYTVAGLGKGGEMQPRKPVAQSPRNIAATPAQSEPIQIAKPSPPQLPATVEGIAIRDPGGRVTGWVCPGCKKELSISGWSRHKKSCPELAKVEVK